VAVTAEGIAMKGGRVTGRARTVADWLRVTGAAAGINGSFFGESFGDDRKEVLGLLALNGRVRSAARVYHSERTGRSYAHCAFGLTAEGRPRIAWVTSR